MQRNEEGVNPQNVMREHELPCGVEAFTTNNVSGKKNNLFVSQDIE